MISICCEICLLKKSKKLEIKIKDTNDGWGNKTKYIHSTSDNINVFLPAKEYTISKNNTKVMLKITHSQFLFSINFSLQKSHMNFIYYVSHIFHMCVLFRLCACFYLHKLFFMYHLFHVKFSCIGHMVFFSHDFYAWSHWSILQYSICLLSIDHV